MRFNVGGALKALVLAGAVMVPLCAQAFAVSTEIAFVREAGRTSIPIGHAQFCIEYPLECGRNAAPVAVQALTEARWNELLQVNAAINAAVQPTTDEELYRTAEYWTYPDGYGDCEDYVLEKRRRLISRGWPASTLLVTVVRQANGEGHAVLTVRTDRGDLILDNQEGMVRLWSETPYRYLKRQSQLNSAEWVALDDTRSQTFALR